MTNPLVANRRPPVASANDRSSNHLDSSTTNPYLFPYVGWTCMRSDCRSTTTAPQGFATFRPSAASRHQWPRRNDRAGTIRHRQCPSQRECSHPHSDETARSRRSPRKTSTAAVPHPAFSPDGVAASPQTVSRSASRASWDANPQDSRFDTTRIAPPCPPTTPLSSARHPRASCLPVRRRGPARAPAQPRRIPVRVRSRIVSSWITSI